MKNKLGQIKLSAEVPKLPNSTDKVWGNVWSSALATLSTLNTMSLIQSSFKTGGLPCFIQYVNGTSGKAKSSCKQYVIS